MGVRVWCVLDGCGGPGWVWGSDGIIVGVPRDGGVSGCVGSLRGLLRPSPQPCLLPADGSALPLPLAAPGPTAAELLRRPAGGAAPPARRHRRFALWLGPVSPPEVQLKPRHRPLRLVRHWPELLLRFSLGSPAAIAQDEPCLQLRRNVFFPKSRELESQLQEEELLRLLYEEAREQLRGGRYPVDPPEAAELGWLSCRLRLGPFEPGRHTELSLYPGTPPTQTPKDTHGFFKFSVFEPHGLPPDPQTFRHPDPRVMMPKSSLWGAVAFGVTQVCVPSSSCAFFPGAIERPSGGLLARGGLRPVSVAVGLEGLTPSVPPQHVLLSLTYPELCWELDGDPTEPPQLWLEFDGDHEGAPVNRLLRVFSPQVRRDGWGSVGEISPPAAPEPRPPRRAGPLAAQGERDAGPPVSVWRPSTTVAGGCERDRGQGTIRVATDRPPPWGRAKPRHGKETGRTSGHGG
uniref:FERM central domain-containing protein n=1 Tax=Malurus cyaneus samueli TaxID=2593467 RepID=A0A8C5UCW5_9PASS